MSEKRIFCTAGCPSLEFTAKQTITREVFVMADVKNVWGSDPEKVLSKGETFDYICERCGAPGELREVPDGYWAEFCRQRSEGGKGSMNPSEDI